jgi:hypothetical protein
LSAGDNDCNEVGFGVIELQDCEWVVAGTWIDHQG